MLRKAVLTTIVVAGIVGIGLGSGILEAQAPTKPSSCAPEGACPAKAVSGGYVPAGAVSGTQAKGSGCSACASKDAPVARLASTPAATTQSELCPHLISVFGNEGARAVTRAIAMGLVQPTAKSHDCPALRERQGCPAEGCQAKACADKSGCPVQAAAKAGTIPAARIQPLPAAETASTRKADSVTCDCGKQSSPVGFAVIRSGKTHFFCNEACRDTFIAGNAACPKGCGCDKAGCGAKKECGSANNDGQTPKGCCPSAKPDVRSGS